MEYFNYNGKILVQDKPVIGPRSRAVRYGDGLFETIKSVNGELLFADDHFERLWDGLQSLHFKIPVHLTLGRLQKEITELLKKNKHDKLARIRLSMLRGNGGLFDDISHQPEYIIQTWALPENAGEWNNNGITMGIYQHARKCRDQFSNIKHNNFLPYLLAALTAKEQKWNDAVLLNDAGRICDSSIANIFIVKDEVVFTPALAEGCIAGIIRKNLVKHFAATNIAVKETSISIEELLKADEVFLTNSVFNMRWVQAIGESRYSNRMTQKIYAESRSTIFR
jgi:branched-chain amino acid aminotransferase